MQDCKSCNNQNWKNHYEFAQKRFDKHIAILSICTLIAFAVTVSCLIATIYTIIRVQRFISSFEYVEETTYTIEQDEGTNTAVIGSNNEVIVNGTDNN